MALRPYSVLTYIRLLGRQDFGSEGAPTLRLLSYRETEVDVQVLSLFEMTALLRSYGVLQLIFCHVCV
jgi:hypothetical protein